MFEVQVDNVIWDEQLKYTEVALLAQSFRASLLYALVGSSNSHLCIVFERMQSWWQECRLWWLRSVYVDAEEIMRCVQCVSFILYYLKWHLFPVQKKMLYTWYGISFIMSGHLRCLQRFLAYWKLTNLLAPTKMRKFNEEQWKFIVRIFAIQSSAT